jgi:hypothetical protein
MLASTLKPRLVKLAISPESDDSFSIGGSVLKATRYETRPASRAVRPVHLLPRWVAPGETGTSRVVTTTLYTPPSVAAIAFALIRWVRGTRKGGAR